MTEPHAESALEELRAYLANRVRVQREFNSQAQGNSFPYICMEDFVLRHGHGMQDRLLEGYQRGEPQLCFENSQRLAITNPSLTYFEGFATGIIPVHHAWCCDEQGRVIDSTWDESTGRAYFGAPFQTSYLQRLVHQNHRWHSVLNDWQNDFPLLSGAHDAGAALAPWPAPNAAPRGPTL